MTHHDFAISALILSQNIGPPPYPHPPTTTLYLGHFILKGYLPLTCTNGKVCIENAVNWYSTLTWRHFLRHTFIGYLYIVIQ